MRVIAMDLLPPAEFPPIESSPARARHHVEAVLRAVPEVSSADATVIALLVGEAVTNALVHARSSAVVSVELRPGLVHVTVRDRSETLPVPREPCGRPSGLGLQLIAELADDWGVEPLPDGKAVWFDVLTSAEPERAGAAD